MTSDIQYVAASLRRYTPIVLLLSRRAVFPRVMVEERRPGNQLLMSTDPAEVKMHNAFYEVTAAVPLDPKQVGAYKFRSELYSRYGH